jgi:hypothetical protein
MHHEERPLQNIWLMVGTDVQWKSYEVLIF